MGCSPWGRKELDMTKWLHFHFHFSLSCIGEENGNQLQCSCLENLRDGGACWAAIYGVAQSRTRLKQLSSSSSLAHKLIELLKADISDTWKNVMLQKARALWRSYFNHQRAHVISSTLKTISEICFLQYIEKYYTYLNHRLRSLKWEMFNTNDTLQMRNILRIVEACFSYTAHEKHSGNFDLDFWVCRLELSSWLAHIRIFY